MLVLFTTIALLTWLGDVRGYLLKLPAILFFLSRPKQVACCGQIYQAIKDLSYFLQQS